MMRARVRGIGVRGPGLNGWPECAAILRGAAGYTPAPTVLTPPQLLPPAERRRSTASVKLALTCGWEAVQAARVDPAQLPSVFSSSGSDGRVCHEICESLAGPREVSPTHFHNSVHNAPSGYWSIATGAMRAGNVLCAYDASFAAGLLEALVQCVTGAEPVLLVSYDTPYPSPLHEKRPLADAFGVALVLAPDHVDADGMCIRVELREAAPSRMRAAALDALRENVPAARALSLLERLALGETGGIVLPYLAPRHLAVTIDA